MNRLTTKLSFRFLLTLGALCCALQACAWNNTGHMVVAELAWRSLSAGERSAVSQLLRQHPHYAELLAVDIPSDADRDEWIFLRAATWPDLVRPAPSGQPPQPAHITAYHHPDWHYIDLPFVAANDLATILPSAHPPPPTNAVERLAYAEAQLRSPQLPAADRAVALCWYLHLVGDIHQPLHCAEWFSPEFPQGDRGGNEVAIKPQSEPLRLHTFWDALLGTGQDSTFIEYLADDIAADPKLARARLRELKSHQTYPSWTAEGLHYARAFAYLDGQLKHAKWHGHITAAEVPDINFGYEENARSVARRRIALAGFRLANGLKRLF